MDEILVLELQKKRDSIDLEIKALKEKRRDIGNKLSKEKLYEKKQKKKNGNSVNELIRVSKSFDLEIIDIQEKRMELERDGKFVSKPILTSLIVMHKNWLSLKEDLINFDFDTGT